MLRLPPISTLFPYTTLFRSYIATCIGNRNVKRVASTVLSKEFWRDDKLALIACFNLGFRVTRKMKSYLHDYSFRSEEHTSELQSLRHLVCRLLLEKKNTSKYAQHRPRRVDAADRHDEAPPRWDRSAGGSGDDRRSLASDHIVNGINYHHHATTYSV